MCIRDRELYKDGDAAFIANIGSLIEPMGRQEYKDGTKRIPPQVFAHNMGTQAAHNVHPQALSSKGVLGRILDALAAQQSAKGAAYSIAGNAKIVEGGMHGKGRARLRRRRACDVDLA